MAVPSTRHSAPVLNRALHTYTMATWRSSAALPTEKCRCVAKGGDGLLGGLGRGLRTASSEQRAPNGRKRDQKNSTRNKVSPAWSRGGVRTWMDANKTNAQNAAIRVRYPNSKATRATPATRKSAA